MDASGRTERQTAKGTSQQRIGRIRRAHRQWSELAGVVAVRAFPPLSSLPLSSTRIGSVRLGRGGSDDGSDRIRNGRWCNVHRLRRRRPSHCDSIVWCYEFHTVTAISSSIVIHAHRQSEWLIDFAIKWRRSRMNGRVVGGFSTITDPILSLFRSIVRPCCITVRPACCSYTHAAPLPLHCMHIAHPAIHPSATPPNAHPSPPIVGELATADRPVAGWSLLNRLIGGHGRIRSSTRLVLAHSPARHHAQREFVTFTRRVADVIAPCDDARRMGDGAARSDHQPPHDHHHDDDRYALLPGQLQDDTQSGQRAATGSGR